MTESPFSQRGEDVAGDGRSRNRDAGAAHADAIAVGPARREESGALARLLTAIMRQHGLNPSPERVQKAIDDVFAHPEWAEFVVARRAGAVVGMLTLVRSYSTWAASPYATVDDFIVGAEERGRGTGVALMRAAVAQARQAGFARLELNVEKDNEGALRFYEKFGFTKQSRFLYAYTL